MTGPVPPGGPAPGAAGGLTADRVAGLRSGQRAAVRAAIDGLPRSDLAAWLRTADGEAVLRDALERMPDYYVGGHVEATCTARWTVQRPPQPAVEVDLVIGPQRCVVGPARAGTRPDVTLVLDAVSFVELASATRPGMELLLHGRLHIQGDVQLAMRMESLFGLGGETRHP